MSYATVLDLVDMLEAEDPIGQLSEGTLPNLGTDPNPESENAGIHESMTTYKSAA